MSEQFLPTPEEAARRLWQRIPGYIKWTFVVTVVMGLVAHAFAFTNDLINHDDIYHVFQCDYGVLSGRWFLPEVLQWDGDFSVPWLIGLLSLLCLAVTACFSVSLLRIRGRVGCLVTAALLTAFPTVCGTFSYMFTADAYFFAMALAAFAAYATARMPIMGLPLGAVAMVLSLGIYQSYFPVAAVLMVGALFFDALEGRERLLTLFVRGVKMVLALGLGLVVYLAAAKFATRNVGLTDYMGIAEMGHLDLATLPSLIKTCYTYYLTEFWQDPNGYLFAFIQPLFLLVFVASMVLFLTLLVRRSVGLGHGLLATLLALLYPLAGDLIHIMVAGGQVHTLMIYGMVYVLVLPVALASFAMSHAEEMGGARRFLQTLASWVVMLAMSLVAYSYIITDNKAYQKMVVSKDEITAYSNRLVAAVEQTPGYTPGMTMLLIGSRVSEPMLSVPSELNELYVVGVLDMSQLRRQYSYGEFLQYYIGYPGRVGVSNSADEDLKAVTQAYAERADVLAMPNYPASGSIQIIDGYVVVKIATPEPLPGE